VCLDALSTGSSSPESATPSAPLVAQWTSPNTSATGLPPGAVVTAMARFRGRLIAAGLFLPHCASQFPQDTCSPGPTAREPVVWTSPDGSAWSEAWDPGQVVLGTDTSQQLVAAPNRLLLLDEGTASSALWFSTDATSWERVTLPAAMGGFVFRDATWGHGRFVAVLSAKFPGGSTTTYGSSDAVWTSSDGVDWHQAALGEAARLNAVTSTRNGFLVGGQSGRTRVTQHSTVWVSTDGMHWRSISLGDYPGSVISVAADATAMVAGGYERGDSHIWWSKDGSTWLQGTGFNPSGPGPLHATPELFIGRGGSGLRLWSSPTGAAWTPVTNKGAPPADSPSVFPYLLGLWPDLHGVEAVVSPPVASLPGEPLSVQVWHVSFTSGPTRSSSR